MTIYWPDEILDPPTQPDRFRLRIPEGLLDRHGARMLDPATAPRRPDGSAPGPTAYRSSVLLIPPDMLDNETFMATANAALHTMKVELTRPDPDIPWPRATPRPVVLQVTSHEGGVTVDAWWAMQRIRGALDALKDDDPLKEQGARISLDHLFIASSVNGVLGGVPGAGQGYAPTDPDDVFTYGYERRPLALTLPPAVRDHVGRRPVIAVLDTGIRHNRWLDIPPWNSPKPGEQPTPWATGPFVSTDAGIQKLIGDICKYLRAQGENVEVLSHVKDEPVSAAPLVGELDTHTGHGTFIAGIIQQVEPRAEVLAIRVMSSDGVVMEDVLLAALGALVDRIDKDGLVLDVVSLSLGYAPEMTEAEEVKSPLAVQLRELRKRGVVIVAAAGNSATSARFAPASFADHADQTALPVISVSALNPNGSKAVFGNAPQSLTCWATGAGVVSTFPEDVNASRAAHVRLPAVNGQGLPQTRESTDGDDYSSGFAVWWGTSFAAPHVAAHIAKAVIPPASPLGAEEVKTRQDEQAKVAPEALDPGSRASQAILRVRAEALKSAPKPPAGNGDGR